MRTHLCRTCHTGVFGICNSRLPFCTDFLGLRLKVASTCRAASWLTRGRPLLFWLKCIPVFKVVKPALYRCSMRWIRTKPFSEGPLNTGAWFVFAYSITQVLFFMGRLYFWKLRSLAVKIIIPKIYRQVRNLWEFDFPLIEVIYGYAL
jgi:hypothetical protein